MKSKVSPTSPKVNKKHQSDIQKLYDSNLQTIQKPSAPRSYSLSFLIIVIVVGFIAGFLAPIIYVSYGSDIPLINKLNIFTYPTNFSYLFSGGAADVSDPITEMKEELEQTSHSVVQIYRSRTLDDDAAGIAPSAGASLGSGFILSEDGYIVTSAELVGSAGDFIVVTHDGKEYAVGSIQSDLASGLQYLKIDAEALDTVSLAESNSIEPYASVIMMRYFEPGKDPLVQQNFVSNTEFRFPGALDQVYYPSDTNNYYMLLGEFVSDWFDHSIVFTQDLEALGIVRNIEGAPLVVPFSLTQEILRDLLAGEPIVRPYLGVRYIDLHTAPDVSVTDNQGLQQGALISTGSEDIAAIIENSPAQRAGLQTGDIIVSVDGILLNGQTDLSKRLQSYESGDLIDLEVSRDGEIQSIKVTLESLVETSL